MQIEKGIPMPTTGRGRYDVDSVVERMEPGTSIVLPENYARAVARRIKMGGYLTATEKTENGVRVWMGDPLAGRIEE